MLGLQLLDAPRRFHTVCRRAHLGLGDQSAARRYAAGGRRRPAGRSWRWGGVGRFRRRCCGCAVRAPAAAPRWLAATPHACGLRATRRSVRTWGGARLGPAGPSARRSRCARRRRWCSGRVGGAPRQSAPAGRAGRHGCWCCPAGQVTVPWAGRTRPMERFTPQRRRRQQLWGRLLDGGGDPTRASSCGELCCAVRAGQTCSRRGAASTGLAGVAGTDGSHAGAPTGRAPPPRATRRAP